MSAETLASSIAVKGFSGLLTNLATSYLKKNIRSLSENEDQIKTDLNDHLQTTFNKCYEIKTILSDKKSEKTLELYVDQFFMVGDKEIDQYSLIDMIKSGYAAVITGTGGGGKSMFMRYLWLSLFEDSQGKIPFFLELRQLNFLTHNSIIDFIFHSIIKSGSTISQLNFKKALRAGDFVLFFDGFDEVNHDIRDKIENMIISLRENYPDLTIIVTSRSDERFVGWHQFEICEVMPLKEPQVKELISKAAYPDEYKNIFLSQLESIYLTHESFLNTPLLAYMMLVTFSYNRDIPNKMFLFYEQAFDALYARHDLTKGGYRRKFYTNLDRQEFIRLVSFFCLKGYYDQKFEFTEDEINQTIDQAKSIENFSVRNSDFIKDMSESVCLLKRDGLLYSFTHRSFQEYFAAYCISRVANRNVEKIFTTFGNRYNDSVMRMVYDMNVDLFREKYIIPLRKKHLKFFARKRRAELLGVYLFESGAKIGYTVPPYNSGRKKGKLRDYGIESFSGTNDLHAFYRSILCVMSEKIDRKVDIDKVSKLDLNFVCFVSRLLKPVERLLVYISSNGRNMVVEGVPDEYQKIILDEMKKGGFCELIRENVEAFHDFVNGECLNYKKVTDSFDDFFE